MGTNDGVLWYVPFIMVFYVLFFIVAVNNWSRLILVFSGIIIFVLLELVGVESQWYTSIGALIFGVYAGKLKNKRKYIVGFTFLFLICTIATIKLENVLLLKDVFTAIAGIGFCGMVFNIVMLIPSRELENSKQVVTIASSSVYWTYLIHMKVGKVLENLIGSSLPLFLVISVLSAILLNECYRLFKRYLKQLWHHNL